MAKFAFAFRECVPTSIMETSITYDPRGMSEEALKLPLCKSISARVACLDYLSGRDARMHLSGRSTDEEVIAAALGQGPMHGIVNVGESGTALRFLSAMAASTPGREITITGAGSRIMHRPMAPLLEALQALGAPAPEVAGDSLCIRGARLHSRGEITLDASESSQYVSALLLRAPGIEGGLRLRLSGRPVSMPYISMTLRLMEAYGIKADAYPEERLIIVPEGLYTAPQEYICEHDWSSASYFLELALLSGKHLTLPHLPARDSSLQGDSVCSEIFASPAFHGDTMRLERDMSACPDLVPAVAAACAGKGVPFRISGIGHLRHKESDRIKALCAELGKMGAMITAGDDHMEMDHIRTLTPPRLPLCSHGDHRIVMALTPLSAVVTGIRFDSACEETAKSFPGFWKEMHKCGIARSVRQKLFLPTM